jgi:hypothetical protein
MLISFHVVKDERRARATRKSRNCALEIQSVAGFARRCWGVDILLVT